MTHGNPFPSLSFSTYLRLSHFRWFARCKKSTYLKHWKIRAKIDIGIFGHLWVRIFRSNIGASSGGGGEKRGRREAHLPTYAASNGKHFVQFRNPSFFFSSLPYPGNLSQRSANQKGKGKGGWENEILPFRSFSGMYTCFSLSHADSNSPVCQFRSFFSLSQAASSPFTRSQRTRASPAATRYTHVFFPTKIRDEIIIVFLGGNSL